LTIITVKQASEILDVSEATVRNWIRHGYLKPLEYTKSKFRDTDVNDLKEKIKCGKIKRLRNRANKRNAGNLFVPEEYLGNITFISETEQIRNIFINNHLNTEITLFVLILKQLVLSGEVVQENASNVLKIETYSCWRRECVKDEIISWSRESAISEKLYKDGYIKIYNALTDISQNDTVGIIYQSLLPEGSKSKQGSYYTPKSVVDAIFREYRGDKGKFLDPCCGTGQFLIGAARSGYCDPELLYGYDIDGLAVRIARINLLLAFREKEFSPRIYKADILKDIAADPLFCETDGLKKTFHLTATNPPWGSAINSDDSNNYSSLYPHITSGESFSYFLSECIDLTEKKGHISFILPESVLNIKTHSDIREHILKNTRIKAVYSLGRIFKSVFTPVIRLDLINDKAPDGWILDVELKNRKKYQIPQSRFNNNDNFIFDVNLSEDEFKILSFLYNKPHLTLKGNSDWALGIVTGDNKKYVSDKKINGAEPIYKGSNVLPYRLSEPNFYIEYKPELFQQAAPEYKYRAPEKLIYKFISDRLVFAYDRNRSLTLNSANVLLPKLDNYPIKILLGLLNSKLYQFIYSKKFNTHKVLRGDLEKLPFPIIKNEEQSIIISLVEQAIEGKDVQDKLDFEIMKIIGLSKEQIETVMSFDKK